MPADIAACGSIGIAREVTAGTYVAPAKFFPIQSESITYNTEQMQRRGIRQTPDILGVIPSTFSVEGDIEMEAFEEVVPYFLMAGRTNTVISGTTDKTYTITGANCGTLGTLGKTLSVTIVRNGTVQGYTGVQVSSFEFSTSDGVLMFKVSVIGLDEATQADPTETYPATQTPFGPGMYDIEIPLATDVFDVDEFTFTVEDNLTGAQRLRATRGPSFLHYGERTVALSLARDYVNRTDYDAFKALTAQNIKILATKGANNSIQINMPVAYKESYEFNLSGQGDLIRAQIAYFGAVGGGGFGYEIIIKTQEAIT